MSLLYYNNFATKTTLPYDYTFANLFMGVNEEDPNYLMHKDDYDLVLPAKTLRTGCYFRLFYNCWYLDHIVCLATDLSADYCTDHWVHGVDSKGTFVKAEDVYWNYDNEWGVPQGWTIVEQ